MRSSAWRLAAWTSLWIGLHGCGHASAGGAAPAAVPPAPPAEIDLTLFLIGDAGAPAVPPDSEPVFMGLRAAAASVPHAVIVFLGDNVYPSGMPDSAAPTRAAADRALTQELRVLHASGARGVVVPGNHDWDSMQPGGWDAVRRQERFIAAQRDAHVTFLPGGGCPGPAVLDVGRVVRLVALDTQWWLQEGPKPQHPASSCPADSEREVIDSVRAALGTAGARHVVVIAPHPLVSGAGTFGHHYRVTALDSTRFARSASGFMRVEFLRDGRARLGVIIVDRVGRAAEEFGLWLN